MHFILKVYTKNFIDLPSNNKINQKLVEYNDVFLFFFLNPSYDKFFLLLGKGNITMTTIIDTLLFLLFFKKNYDFYTCMYNIICWVFILLYIVIVWKNVKWNISVFYGESFHHIKRISYRIAKVTLQIYLLSFIIH